MTTNETYFFREDSHFKFIEQNIMPHFALKHLRVWSAASSVGAEAYSIAMLLHGRIKSYEIIGTDINSEVIKKASQGLYPIKWMKKIPDHLKHQFCLVGKNQYKGWFLVDRALLKNVQFMVRNLLNIQKDIGSFDVIFLRNVLIYFDKSTKKKIIQNVISNLKVGGYFFISLTEHIAELNIKNLKQVQSSIFQKV
jgi:chemotaxis protein methyltransferase CheR